VTLVRALLVAAACALAIGACERFVVLTPGPDDGGFDSTTPDSPTTLDTGPNLDGGTVFDAAIGADA
jgi:hypothetical protein